EQALPLRLESVAILDAAERNHLLLDFNGNEQPFPQDCTVNALIEAQAASQPDSPAVIQGGHVLTYAQLNERANRLAHYLNA
ncbi:amino acid adenylation, partial [Pseudomonas syringae pv. japonica str. M301072]